MNPLTHLSKTYRQLRLTAGYTLIVAPLLIIAAAYLFDPTIKSTLSHYYFAEPQPGLVRTLFTGFLIFIGGILIAYRGFDNRDNWIHNAAGAFAICVAFFPKRCDPTSEPYCAPGLLSWLHAPSAILLFLFAAWAVVYCGGDKFKSQLEDNEAKTLRQARTASLITMVAGVVLYVARPFLSTAIQDFKVTILFVELLAFFGFAAHWLVMTRVIDKANKRINRRRKFLKSQKNAVIAAPALQPAQPAAIDADEEDLMKIP